ncbi:MAG: hypothetical protein AAF438_22115, partial [Pseudomonadota bacterium]
DRYIVRLNASDGSVDSAFNNGKPYHYHSSAEFSDVGRRLLVESDGSIIAAGYTPFGGEIRHHVVMIRLTPAGVPDSSFGNFISPAATATDLGISPLPGIAMFNPFRVDVGFAENYDMARQSNGLLVTTGYGGATGTEVPSTLGYQTYERPDLVMFRTDGNSVDTSWGNGGHQAIQSEGLGRTNPEERGRTMEILNDDRTVHMGRYGGMPALYIVSADGQLDGIFELLHPDIQNQFYASARSPDGSRIAASTLRDDNGARLVILEVE